jgi:hypothetical protein
MLALSRRRQPRGRSIPGSSLYWRVVVCAKHRMSGWAAVDRALEGVLPEKILL